MTYDGKKEATKTSPHTHTPPPSLSQISEAELDAMVGTEEEAIHIPEELLDDASDKLFPPPPHRIVKKDEDATQPAVQEDDDNSAGETTEDENDKEVAPVVKPSQSRQQNPGKKRNGSAFPSLDHFIQTGNFIRPDASTPEGMDETKRLVEAMLRTGKMHPDLLKTWRSRDVKADSREEALRYKKETENRDQVYDVSGET